MTTPQQTPPSEQKQFMTLYQSHRIREAKRTAEKLITRYPNDAFAWKALGNCLLQSGEFAEAAASLETAFHLTPEDPLVLNAYSRACFHTNRLDKALALQKKSLELEPDNAQGHYNMASMLHQSGNSQDVLQHLDQAKELGFDNAQILSMRSVVLSLSLRFQEGMDELLKLYALQPKDPTVHNSLGNYYKDMADFAKAEAHYQKAKELAPKYATAYSNEILSRHYNPDSTLENVLEAAQEWQRQFACESPYTHAPDPVASGGKLRVGIISGSLRLHPVGWMITSALSHLPKDIELYVYSDSEPGDFIAQRIQQIATQWRPIYHLEHEQVAENIHSDEVHILIDLAGHGSNSRLPAIVMKPAPLIIKWVGTQISSMGIPEFDYFLSDSIETPPGVDDQYTEKLIRLPDDYVCYHPPYYTPAITALPAIANGYITLGCFNNPAKLNNVVLQKWAELMHELPNSRLFLKGGQYSSPEVCERIRNTMAETGITEERLILEGPSKHQELLRSYNRVDIALDPWPYSGGLTTCEAMLMGVPVVTLPGSTFAGRHSATHLTNAGMQELVVSSWEEYRQRVIELASDLPSLAIIRAALRTYLEQSPVCDGPRFGRHLHKTLRAIWQRHCEGKAPAALTFNKGGQAWFEDESKPVKLSAELQTGFNWDLESPVTILDNGANIAMRSDAKELLGSGNITVLAFDPINTSGNAQELAQYGEIQHFPQVTLGNGQLVTLTIAEGEDNVASLKSMTSNGADTLQTLEIPSIALDSIEGLESLDMLILDGRHNNLTILKHGIRALSKTLLLQIRVNFCFEYEDQANLESLTRWANKNDFYFYKLCNEKYSTEENLHCLFDNDFSGNLSYADAIFVRHSNLTAKQQLKTAFLLHLALGRNKKSLALLGAFDKKLAEHYFSFSLQENIKLDEATTIIRTSNIETPSNNGHEISVIMPCINLEEGVKTAAILHARSAKKCHIYIIIDDIRLGFISTANTVFNKLSSKYVVYLAQDAFPGMHWLDIAYKTMEKSKKGLLAFNDGKWAGSIASFGMVRSSWVSKIYSQGLFFDEYNSHCADDEITEIAQMTNQFIYDSNSVLIEIDYNKALTGGGNKHDRDLLNNRRKNTFGLQKNPYNLDRTFYDEEYVFGNVDKHVVLATIHAKAKPNIYLEIGVQTGKSLALAKCHSIGIDPNPCISHPLNSNHVIFNMTSDDFFATTANETIDDTIDFSFIDGMHLFEYALRDFINVEKHSHYNTIVAIDDIFPGHPNQALRERITQNWTGDVWKLVEILEAYRPNLHITFLNAYPTGLLIVKGLDPENTILSQNYDEIVARYKSVKHVPEKFITRNEAIIDWESSIFS
ncbi:O-linked N-acetylglucosamine transferase family protein [Salinicola sp. V024]|uniref:O-linked N-acetylglucosamine transferase family protein n=1 Tax=Salinicola sp. V024 TaxID=3459609 RepID=UPI00404479CE